MTTKQRAYLKGLAMNLDPIFQIGKNSMTPEVTKAIQEALDARELIKVSVLKNCADDPRALAEVIAEQHRRQQEFAYPEIRKVFEGQLQHFIDTVPPVSKKRK